MTTTATPADVQEFLDDLHDKLEGHATRSETDAFLQLWSHAPDASIMAAVGGYRVGYDQVGELLTLRATQVYRREEGVWRLLHRHAEALTPVADLGNPILATK